MNAETRISGRAVDALTQATHTNVDESGLSITGWLRADVTALGDDLREVVVTADGGTTLQTMRCSSGYPRRAAGDQVLCVQTRYGWQVLARINAVADPVVTVLTGSTVPEGWLGPVTDIYYRDDSDGSRSLFLHTP